MPSSSPRLLQHPIAWPSGRSCAMSFSFDVDLASMMALAYGRSAVRRVAGRSWLGYDEVAIPRILELYRELGVQQTFFLPGWCIEHHRHLVEACAADGHEIALHGWIHEIAFELDPGEEERRLDRTIAVAERVLGARPVGWRAPLYGLSEHSARLLAERGFLYDASLMGDDVPYVLETDAGPLIELPSEWANDDWTHYACAPDLDYAVQVRSPAQAAAVYRAEIDAARRHGALWVSVWHPNVSGRLARFELVAELVAEAARRNDVWLAPLHQIATHAAARIADGSFAARTVRPDAGAHAFADPLPNQEPLHDSY